MDDGLVLRIGSHDDLIAYVSRQLDFFGGIGSDHALLREASAAALVRFASLASRAHAFRAGAFDHLHSLQYASYLYLLGNATWRRAADAALVDRLFCLNKMVSAIELHPAVDLPGAFLLSHAIGTVLGAVSYGDGLVVFQNVTVGRVGNNRPSIGRDVVLFAGATVTGRSIIGDGSVVAAGAHVHNCVVPPSSMVRGGSGATVIEPLTRTYHGLYLTSAAPERFS